MPSKRIAFCLVATLIGMALSCGSNPQKNQAQKVDDQLIEQQLQQLSLRQKVGQLFSVRPEALCPEFEESGQGMGTYSLQAVTEGMKERAKTYPVGEVVLFSHNIDNPDQLVAFTTALHQLEGSPLLAIDEEGGRVARIGNNENFDVFRVKSIAEVGATGDPSEAFRCGNEIGKYLKTYGFDVDFGPCADVNTNPENIVIGNRAFSDDPKKAAPMVAQYVKGMEQAGIMACVKHFPGHGDTKGDTHLGYVQTDKTWEEIRQCEMIPFKAGIDAGARMIMTAHIAAPKVTGSEIPSTLSSLILQDKLRKELGYKGLIITDAMGMGAISKHYGSGESAVACLLAGADIVLMPASLPEAFEAVVKAVQDGTITEERLNESVRRVLALKASICQQPEN